MKVLFLLATTSAWFAPIGRAHSISANGFSIIASEIEDMDDGGKKIIGDFEIPFGVFSVKFSGADVLLDGVLDDTFHMLGGNVTALHITEPFLERL